MTSRSSENDFTKRDSDVKKRDNDFKKRDNDVKVKEKSEEKEQGKLFSLG